jgi:hypothetical protein
MSDNTIKLFEAITALAIDNGMPTDQLHKLSLEFADNGDVSASAVDKAGLEVWKSAITAEDILVTLGVDPESAISTPNQ